MFDLKFILTALQQQQQQQKLIVVHLKNNIYKWGYREFGKQTNQVDGWKQQFK